MVADFERCLTAGGLLLPHTTIYRFINTVAARNVDVLFEAELADFASDALLDRKNRLMPGERYRPVASCQRVAAPDKK